MMTMRFAGRFLFTLALALVSPLLAANASQAATLIVSNGILQGADDVDVGGTLYNVRFIDGTCISVYGGCDSTSDFDFDTNAAARVAAQALLDQVFIDTPDYSFDTRFDLTYGCGSTLFCASVIPTRFEPIDRIGGIVAINVGPGSIFGADRVDTFSAGRVSDISLETSFVFAKFSLPNSEPPVAASEPSALALLAGGLVVTGLAGRRRRGR